MAVTLPNPTLTNPIDRTEIEQNDQALADKFGSITNADIAASAGIAKSKLATLEYDLVLTARLRTEDFGLVAGVQFPIATVPYDDSTTAYSIVEVEYFLVTNGAVLTTAAVYDLKYGDQGDSFGTTIASNLTFGTGDTEVRVGTSTAITLDDGATPKYFILEVVTQGIGHSNDFGMIAIKLKRELR